MTRIQFLNVDKLKPHEETSLKRVNEVIEMIKKAGRFTEPILVEKNTMVILDGHHRVEAMKILGYKKIPARMVDYEDVNVSLRRKNLPEKLIKDFVLYLASKNVVMPRKSTRHVVLN